MHRSKEIFYYGTTQPIKEPVMLRAGDLSMLYENGFLRYISLGDYEIIRMIYHAVRDENWGTLPHKISNEKIEKKDDSFKITYDCLCQQNEISFLWKCIIEGKSNNDITFSISGEALTSFHKNRIGFCVLNPIKNFAGEQCSVTDPDRNRTDSSFPNFISPHQPFENIAQFDWKLSKDSMAILEFEGDVFEMKDQRNWTDASYKLHCTPLSAPFPVLIEKGEQVKQKVSLSLKGDLPIYTSDSDHVSLSIDRHSKKRIPLPSIGLELQQKNRKSDKELALLKQARFTHYRLETHFNQRNWHSHLKKGASIAESLGASLESALFFTENAKKEVEKYVKYAKKYDISAINIYSATHKVTPDELIESVLGILQRNFPDSLIGAGTNAYFAELNKDRVPINWLDFLTYSLNPQVHAFDNPSLTETLEAQGYTVGSARQFSWGQPVHISPITLKPRFNPDATSPLTTKPPRGLPSLYDPRQMSLYGACWTLGSLKYLTEAGARHLTYYNTVGPGGIMMGKKDSPHPQKFRAKAGEVFPMYYVFREVMKRTNGRLLTLKSSHPLMADGLAIEEKETLWLCIANFSHKQQEIEVQIEGTNATFFSLDETNVEACMEDVSNFDNLPKQEIPFDHGVFYLKLLPYALGYLSIKQ
ncbi:hypothetical protein R9C00_12800 [Flammeovirgaceae bacterium SG7u.111]|nr:hypothetical protein [Flammeovirgaceae bacterium SG7u.132]WPO38333.1 hypothetical protein R9C00_12800 [Flammeovirgaceae bacterium SG7u.111]